MSTTSPEMTSGADTMPCCANLPGPAAQHEWLHRFAGEWDNETEISMGPDAPPLHTRSTDSARMVGGLWLVSQGRGDTPQGGLWENVMTLGYDVAAGHYVGSWIDCMFSHLWTYTGSVNEAGDTLTLDCEGPCPMDPSTMRKFREVHTFLDADHKRFTSAMLSDDGQWFTCVTVNSTRKS